MFILKTEFSASSLAAYHKTIFRIEDGLAYHHRLLPDVQKFISLSPAVKFPDCLGLNFLIMFLKYYTSYPDNCKEMTDNSVDVFLGMVMFRVGFFWCYFFLLFCHKTWEFHINCFIFTQYFAKIPRLIFIIILVSFVTSPSKLISLFVNVSQKLNKIYKIYFQLNYFMIFWQAQMKQIWWNKIYSVQILKQFLRDIIVFNLHNQTLIFSLFILLLSVSIKLHFRRKNSHSLLRKQLEFVIFY